MEHSHITNPIPVFPGVPPFAVDGEEPSTGRTIHKEQDDGIVRIGDISLPALEFHPASGKGPHPALLVCPGGGYRILAWDKEGVDIASFLNTIGCSAFILRYRCPEKRVAAHADAARAMRLIRARAEEFNICPDKLGAIGFSAGAHLCATISAPADGDTPYPPIDEADKLSYRPDFTLLIYPAYLVDQKSPSLTPVPDFRITPELPPFFISQSENDSGHVRNSLGWYRALLEAGVKAELHVWPDGGHGYGLQRTGCACMEWPSLAANWIRRQTGLK